MQDGLKEMLAADTADNAPFMSLDVDAASYYDMMAIGAADNEDLGESAEFQAAIRELIAAPRDIFERLHVDVLFTQNGVELMSENTLQD